MSKEPKEKTCGCIECKFTFSQKVWFIWERKIVSGIVIGIKSEIIHDGFNIVSIKVNFGGPPVISSTTWLNETECFASKEELIDSIIKQSEDEV